MALSQSVSVEANYFASNLDHGAGNEDQGLTLSEEQVLNGDASARKDNSSIPKLKRTACVLCRKRKLKCDGARPACSTCARLNHDCKYDEVRKKSGPKRGYVKALEARLAQVETMLKSSDGADGNDHVATEDHLRVAQSTEKTTTQADKNLFSLVDPSNGSANAKRRGSLWENSDSLQQPTGQGPSLGPDGDFSWDMVSLGLEEPLPGTEITNELYDIYFRLVHPSTPIIHKPRFFAAMDLAHHLRPPVALRYAMWTLAAGVSDKYKAFAEHFYFRARKYLEKDELRGHGESLITIAHAQAWLLVNIHEFKNMFFPRAWMSSGRAVRLVQMMGLHRLDGTGLEVKQCLPPPKDWTEREERRRTFWMSFWTDRCASMGTGWPLLVDEQDILTNLPAPEDAFQNNKPELTRSLREVMETKSTDFSPFAGSVIMAALFGRNLIHLHRPTPGEREDDLNGSFWQRHRDIDNILLSFNLGLPSELRVPHGLPDPNVVFLNMCIHTSVICLHQSAIFKAEVNRLPQNIGNESRMRCVAAAAEIAGIMRTIAHLDLSMMNPFMAFCLYVGARVFVQYLKARRNDQQVTSSLTFILTTMHVLKRRNPLTESFLAQLEFDMEAAGINIPLNGYHVDLSSSSSLPPHIMRAKENMKGSCSSEGIHGIIVFKDDIMKENPPRENRSDSYSSAQMSDSNRSTPGWGNEMLTPNQGQSNVASPNNSEHSLPIHGQRPSNRGPRGLSPSAKVASTPQPNPMHGSWNIPRKDTYEQFCAQNINLGDEMDLSPMTSTDVANATSQNSSFTPPASDSNEYFSDQNANKETQKQPLETWDTFWRGGGEPNHQRVFEVAKNNAAATATASREAQMSFHRETGDASINRAPASMSKFSAQNNHSTYIDPEDLSAMDQAPDFSKLSTTQFIPPNPVNNNDPTAGFAMPEGWDLGPSTGLTPQGEAFGQDWNELFTGMSGWDGGAMCRQDNPNT